MRYSHFQKTKNVVRRTFKQGIWNLRNKCRKWANNLKDSKVEMQKSKSGPVAKTYLFLFLGLPRTRTNVNDPFIQPYKSNRKGMHWNRLKKLVCLPHILFGIWTDGDPNQDNVVQKPCYSTKFRISILLFMVYLWPVYEFICQFMDY